MGKNTRLSKLESKIQTRLDSNNGRLDFRALIERYEGSGNHSVDIVKANYILKSLDYIGKKKLHMWWTQFKIELNFAFNAYQKKESRVVHSEEIKLRILLQKVKANFPSRAKMPMSR